MVFKLAAPIAFEAASKAFRASTICADAVPANRRNSPMRMHGLRHICFPHFQKINGRTNDSDFHFDIPNGHTYTPEALPTEPNCSSSGHFLDCFCGDVASAEENSLSRSGENF